MFKSKQRIQSAWAKGLMFGKAVGKRDERDRIIELISNLDLQILGTEEDEFIVGDTLDLIQLIEGKRND